MQFAINQEDIRQKYLASVQECQRLHSALEKAHHEAANLDRKLTHARRLLDEEKRKRRTAEDQRNQTVIFQFYKTASFCKVNQFTMAVFHWSYI